MGDKKKKNYGLAVKMMERGEGDQTEAQSRRRLGDMSEVKARVQEKRLPVKVGEDSVSERHSSVSSASDSRCGEQVLNIKVTAENLGKWPLLIWDIPGWETHTRAHIHTRARMQIRRHHRKA